MSFALLLATAATAAVGGAALHTVRGLRQEVAALRADRAADRTEAAELRAQAALTALPQQTRGGESPAAEIRAAVSEALAEERERELAEARAFWAAQEARDAADAPSLLGGLTTAEQESLAYYMPQPSDFTGLKESDLEAFLATSRGDLSFAEEFDLTPYGSAPEEEVAEAEDDEPEEDAAALAAARRRHPSHPDFVPVQSSPAGGDHAFTMSRLEGLAAARAPLADVRPGPLGTLDVYVFADGTTLCMTPGHRETAEQLAEALRAGNTPVLLGGSGISGAYALTFSCGAENVYILADRVIASVPD
ncbi:hypothetical protein ACIO3O_23355 [Streptomyces sp. NPDC087440]|uniref:hypothetical protein n=1 Tax=Streptomyces sp. NPDC087440 TaxID=3365790 RepID=UPI003801C09D